MPSKTTKQATAARIAYAGKTGKISKSKVKGAAKDMMKGMTAAELKKFTKVKKESFDNLVKKILNF